MYLCWLWFELGLVLFFCIKPWVSDLENLTDFQSKPLQSFYIIWLYNQTGAESWFNFQNNFQHLKYRDEQTKLIFHPHDSTQSRVPLVCSGGMFSVHFSFFLQSSCSWLVVTDNIALLLTIPKWHLWSSTPVSPQALCEWILCWVVGVRGLVRPDAWRVSHLSVLFKPIRLRSAVSPRGHTPLTSWNEENG